jgi:hypothetical protein
MSIPDVNATYQGSQYPSETGQVLADVGPGSKTQNLIAYGTATLDGSLTAFNFNFIDGTKTLSFTPSACFVSVCGGDQGATAVITAVADAPTATKAVIRLSGAGTNAKTLKIAVLIVK